MAKSLWRRAEDLLWVAGGDGSHSHAQKVASECGVAHCEEACGSRVQRLGVLCLEQLDVAANLKLSLPFFADQLLGAVHLHGPLGLDTILDFCSHLWTVIQKASGPVCLCCSRRPGAVANSLLLLGGFLILERNYPAAKVLRLLDPSAGGAIPAAEMRFPTPFQEKAKFTEESLLLRDCLFGLEFALKRRWLDRSLDAERRQVAAAYDAVPVFSVALENDSVEQCATIGFWIAADPVTTVQDPQSRPEAEAQDVVKANRTESTPSTGASTTSVSKAVSDSVVKHGKQEHMTGMIRLYKSSTHIHTVSDGMPAQTPRQVWRARADWFSRQLTLPMSSGKHVLPTKVHCADGLKRPADLPAFAQFLQKQSCSLLTRANFGTEKGLPEGGSYGDFFDRRGIDQLDLPFEDGSAPPARLVTQLIAAVEKLLMETGEESRTSDTVRNCSVVVHCKSGLGRSMSLLAALALAFCPGLTAGAFFGWARLVRPACLQTPAQEKFLRSLDEETAVCSCLFACFGKKPAAPAALASNDGKVRIRL
ncbi:unnamed protein product [Effrenium voratum]|uniref:Tyrosine specific protein phosphatases domain-containing protein n=1 Tax=Effrenium voratum TaxID=2562239 RepID=A0AA36HVF5_9DINO|nr:unnamed protein product [Effrenium voratum]